MGPPIFDPLVNITAPPKLILGVAQALIIIDHKELLDEDDDSSQKNTTLRCHELYLSLNHTMNEGANHP